MPDATPPTDREIARLREELRAANKEILRLREEAARLRRVLCEELMYRNATE